MLGKSRYITLLLASTTRDGAPAPRIKRGRWRWPLELSGRTKSLIGLVGVRDRGAIDAHTPR